MQETKYAVMSSLKCAKESAQILSEVVPSLSFDKKKIVEEIEEGFACATELSDVLVSSGIPFRTAHEIAGNLVKQCLAEKKYLSSLSVSDVEKAAKTIGGSEAKSLKIDEKKLKNALNPDKTSRYDGKFDNALVEKIKKMEKERKEKLDKAAQLLENEIKKVIG